MDVGRRDLDAADQAGALVGRHVRLVAVHGLAPAVPGPARLAIAPDAGGRDQGGVHQRAGAHHDALGLELARDRLEQRPVQAAPDQLAAEADEGGALGRRLVGGEAAEPAEAGAVVQRLGELHVGEVVPGRQQQATEQGQRRPARLALRRRRDAGQARSISAQSSSAASSDSDDAARGSGRAMRSSCPIRRRAMPTSAAKIRQRISRSSASKHIRAQVS